MEHKIDFQVMCQQYLDIVYADIIKNATSFNHRNKEKVYETQGEILYPSILKILSTLKMTRNDVFMDFGAGLGKIVAQVFLLSDIKEIYGIEIIPEIYQLSVCAMQRIEQDLAKFSKKPEFILFNGSFLELCFPTVTVALINSVCISSNTLSQLGVMLDATPSVHTVLTLRPINTLKRFSLKRMISIECSWDSAVCYVYTSPSHLNGLEK